MLNETETIRRFENASVWAKTLGLKLEVRSSFFALVPYDECLPIYSRDADIASGGLETIVSFLQGWDKARQYLRVLGVAKDDRVEKFEQNHRDKYVINILKNDTTN